MSVLKTDQLSVKGRETLCLFSPIYRHCFRRVWWRKPGASPRRRNARLARVSGGITQEPERWSLLLKDVQGKCTKQILPLDCTHKHMQMHWRSQWITRAQCRNRRCWLKYLFKWIVAMKKQMQQLGAPLPHTETWQECMTVAFTLTPPCLQHESSNNPCQEHSLRSACTRQWLFTLILCSK